MKDKSFTNLLGSETRMNSVKSYFEKKQRKHSIDPFYYQIEYKYLSSNQKQVLEQAGDFMKATQN